MKLFCILLAVFDGYATLACETLQDESSFSIIKVGHFFSSSFTATLLGAFGGRYFKSADYSTDAAVQEVTRQIGMTLGSPDKDEGNRVL